MERGFAEILVRRGLGMRRVFAFTVLLWTGLCWSVGYGQTVVDDKGRGLDDHNYFAASSNPELKALLQNVENHHLNRTNTYPGGVLEQIQRQHYDYAIADLRYALIKFPNHPKALMLLGLVARLKRNPSIPIPFYEKAIELYPAYAITHAQYGKYLLDIGYPDQAINKLNDAIRVDPGFSAGYAWLAEAYYKKGNRELASQAAEKARTLGYRGEIEGER